jgi:ABC-type Fe3+ transport system permease subunit
MIQLSDDQKFQVLLAELAERYNAAHKIRERSTQFTLWLSGFAIGLAWLLVSQSPLPTSQRIGLTLLILVFRFIEIYLITRTELQTFSNDALLAPR